VIAFCINEYLSDPKALLNNNSVKTLMISKIIIIDIKKEEELMNTIQEFVYARNYVIKENIENSILTFIIYDRDLESGSFINTLKLFVGSYFIPERVRIKCSIKKTEKFMEVTVRANVMLNEHNYINDRPRRGDLLRCEALFELFIEKLIQI